VKNTRVITEGAVLLAVFIVLLLATMYIPIIMIVLQLFLILPFLIYSAKHPLKYAIVFFIAAMLVTVGTGQIQAIPLTIMYGLIGTLVGYGIRTKKDQGTIFIYSSILCALLLVLLFALASKLLDIQIMDEIQASFDMTMEQYHSVLNSLGQEMPAGIEEQFQAMLATISSLLVSLIITTAFIFTWILFLVNYPIVRRLGIDAPRFGSFRNFRLPKAVLGIYLVVLLISLFANPEEGSYFYLVFVNGIYILQTLMVIQGLSFIFYICHVRKLPIFLPILVVIFTFILPILPIVRVLGIIDVGFDLRQRLEQK